MTYQIFKRELLYWLKNPLFYGYLIVFSAIGFLAFAGSAGLFDDPTSGATAKYLNSPYEINFIFQYFNKFLLFLVPAICGSSIYRDFRSNTYSILYSYPVDKFQYLIGKFLGSFLAVLLIALGLGIAIGVAEHLPELHSDKIGAFQPLGYLQVYLIYTLPNLFYISLVVFMLVANTRNIFAGFGTIVILIFLQIITENAFSGNSFLIAFFDPFGQNTSGYETQLWTLDQRNTSLLPISSTIILNRLLWIGIGLITGSTLFNQFALEEDNRLSSRKLIFRKEKSGDKIIYDKQPTLIQPEYTRKSLFSAIHKMVLFDLKFITRHWMFILFVILGLFAVLFAIGKVTNTGDFTLLPTTRLVLSVPAFFFSGIATMITFIYSGMIIHRNRNVGINSLIDVTPLPNGAFLFSKLITIILMQGILLSILIFAGVLIQLYNGYYEFQIDIYLFHLLLLVFPILIIWAGISVFIHNLFSNLYMGFFFLLMAWIGIPGLTQVGIDTRLLNFYADEIIVLSDFAGYLTNAKAYLLTKGYWFCIGALLIIISYFMWVRGADNSFKQRVAYAKSLISNTIFIPLIFVISLGSFLGFHIYHGEKDGTNFIKASRGKIEAFREKFSIYENLAQPKIVDVKLEMDLFPKANSFQARGAYILVNKSTETIDRLLIKTGFDERTDILETNRLTLIDEDFFMKFKVFKLNHELAPGDSMQLAFDIKSMPNTLFEKNSNVLENGTFIKDDILPRLGYEGGEERLSPIDSTVRANNYLSKDSDYVTFQCVISTSKDQIAITPGKLISKWSTKERNYFHYEASQAIKFGFGFQSGRWVEKKKSYEGIDLFVYSHPNHQQNVDNMLSGLAEAIAYNTKYFSPYQHHEAKIIEFPNSEGTYATTFSNTMPTSEHRFIAEVDTSKSIDIAFYVAAHELTHQWWANQVVPANAKGSVMLTESITEYITLDIYRNKYGKEKAFDFLKKQRMRYLIGRTKEEKAEPPLSLVSGSQQYLAYGKGAMVFNALQHYLGREDLNKILREFLLEYAFKGSPYPTSLDLTAKLHASAPDSLKSVISELFHAVTFQNNTLQDASISKTGKDEYTIELTITHQKDVVSGEIHAKDDMLQIGFFDNGDKLITTENIFLKEGINQFSFSTRQLIAKAILDPNMITIDKNLEDNVAIVALE